MSQNFLFNASFHLLLANIDQEILNNTLAQGCLYCKGQLHRADYPRSPAGVLSRFREYYDERYSLCCNTCRKRTTPPSVRFFGRRRAPAPILLLISALSLGINERRLNQVKKYFGITVSESTWKRWRRWWRQAFAATKFWKKEKGLVAGAIDTSRDFRVHY